MQGSAIPLCFANSPPLTLSGIVFRGCAAANVGASLRDYMHPPPFGVSLLASLAVIFAGICDPSLLRKFTPTDFVRHRFSRLRRCKRGCIAARLYAPTALRRQLTRFARCYLQGSAIPLCFANSPPLTLSGLIFSGCALQNASASARPIVCRKQPSASARTYRCLFAGSSGPSLFRSLDSRWVLCK